MSGYSSGCAVLWQFLCFKLDGSVVSAVPFADREIFKESGQPFSHYVYIYIHTYITLHFITFHYITLHIPSVSHKLMINPSICTRPWWKRKRRRTWSSISSAEPGALSRLAHFIGPFRNKPMGHV